MLKTLAKKFLYYTYRPLLSIYLAKERKYYYKGMRLVVLPGVFHPGLFYSTKFLLEHIDTLALQNKKILELGAGTGMLSIFCAKKDAIVTASDISYNAILNIDKNTRWNRSVITLIRSDLFQNIPAQQFDYIIVNPPYYKKDPKKDSEYAWFCGKQLEYFTRFFSGIQKYMTNTSQIIMVLSSDCDINGIKKIAEVNNFTFKKIAEKKLLLEENYIFEIISPFYPVCKTF